MRYERLPMGMAVMAILLLGSGGCATRGFVRGQIADLRSEMNTSNESMRADIGNAKGAAAEADSKAVSAVQGIHSVQDLALGHVGYKETSRYSIHFPFNSAEPLADSDPILEKAAEQISQSPQTLVELYGFCDPKGSEAYNYELGRRRAETVLRHLSDCVPGQLSRVQLVSFGKNPPAREEANLGTGASRRQVEIVLLEKTVPEKGTAPVASQEQETRP